MIKRQNYVSNNTIQPTAEVTWRFGTDKSVPYEQVVRFPIHPTFVNSDIVQQSRVKRSPFWVYIKPGPAEYTKLRFWGCWFLNEGWGRDRKR